MSLTAGILLILLVAVPPLVTTSRETGRLSAGTFLVGYTMAFSIPMAGGFIADWTGDARHAILTIIAYSILVIPLAFTLDLNRVGGGVTSPVLSHHRAYGSVPRRFMVGPEVSSSYPASLPETDR